MTETPSPTPDRSPVQKAGWVALVVCLTLFIGVAGFFMLGFSTLGCRNVSGTDATLYGWLVSCLSIGTYLSYRLFRPKPGDSLLGLFAVFIGLEIVALIISFVFLGIACG